MASRTGPDGLLAKLAKVVGAGTLLPALAAAAMLALAGCGGDDDSSEGNTTGNTTEQSAGAEAGDNDGAGGKASEGDGEGAGKGTGGGEDGDAGAQGGQQGPGAAQPEGEREPGITPQQRQKATAASLTLTSPAFQPGKALPSVHTCDGADTSPPLRWTGVPDGTAELVLLTLNFQPVNEALFFDWAVAGLDPGLASLEAGKLPPGAVLGKNSFGKRGYSICPPSGSETYIFMLYAIPSSLDLEAGFDPLAAREAVLDQAGDVGLLSATYARQ